MHELDGVTSFFAPSALCWDPICCFGLVLSKESTLLSRPEICQYLQSWSRDIDVYCDYYPEVDNNDFSFSIFRCKDFLDCLHYESKEKFVPFGLVFVGKAAFLGYCFNMSTEIHRVLDPFFSPPEGMFISRTRSFWQWNQRHHWYCDLCSLSRNISFMSTNSMVFDCPCPTSSWSIHPPRRSWLASCESAE